MENNAELAVETTEEKVSEPIVTEPEEETTTTTTTTTKTDVEEVPPVCEEQENVTNETPAAPPASLSPARSNVPLKEVNESEKEEATPILTNGTETTNSKKRELETEEERNEENGVAENDEQTKKLKTTETIETPTIETGKDAELVHPVVNGTPEIEA